MFRIVKRVIAGLASAALAAGVLTVVAAPAAASGGWGTSGPDCVEIATDQFKPMFLVDASADADPNLVTVDFYHGTNVLNLSHVVYTLAPNESKVFQFDLTGLAPDTTYYYVPLNSDIIEYTVPDCRYDPTMLSVQYTDPVCYDGVRDNHMLVTSLNPGFWNELYDVKVNHVSNPGFPMLAPTGETVDLGNVISSTAPPGTYMVELFNKGVLQFGVSVVVAEPCVSVTPTQFAYTFETQTVNPDGQTVNIPVRLTNNTVMSRQTAVFGNDQFVADASPLLAPNTSVVVNLTAPACVQYPLTLSFGFPEPAFSGAVQTIGCSTASLPVLTVGPKVVASSFRVGSTATCAATYTGATSKTFGWKFNGVVKPGATKQTYVLTSAELGKRASCFTTATNLAGTTPVATSASSAVVALGLALKVRTKPSIAGTSSPGKTLTCKVGSWTPAATSYKCQWQVLVKGKYVNISRATAKTYKVPKAYDNKYLRVVVTALKTGYNKGVYASARVYI